MKKSFRISDKLKLPYECVTWVNAFLAKRGAGKTYNAAVLAEEMLKANVPIVVIDGMSTWYGLRVGYDGKGNGLPIVVFGGTHADIPLDPQKARDVARAVVETNISIVLDVGEFSKGQSRKIVADFLEELYKLNRVERHVFIEEADLWAPQRTMQPEQAVCLGAVDNFVRRGGNHNLGCSLITQRSAVLNKDILTQADCLVILRTLAPQDKKAIQAWVEEQTDEDRKKLNKWYDSLKSLENGEAWVWHPEDPKIFKKVQFRKRETFHATRKFLLNSKADKIKLMDVGEFLDKFRKKFEPKKKPEETMKSASGKMSSRPDPRVLKDLETKHQKELQATALKYEKLGFAKAQKAYEEKITEYSRLVRQLNKKIMDAANALGTGTKVVSLPEPVKMESMTKFKMEGVRSGGMSFQGIDRSYKMPINTPKVRVTMGPAFKVAPVDESFDDGNAKLDRCAGRIYSLLFAWPERSFSKPLIGALTGYAHTSGNFSNAIYRLNTMGLIRRSGDDIQLQEARDDLVDRSISFSVQDWLNKLGACPKKIFALLLDEPDTAFTKEEIAEKTGYSAGSGNFSNAIYRLNALGLIKRNSDGTIQFNENIREFLE